MSNNDNASTIDQSPRDSSQHVSELKINTVLNDSSPTPFRMSSPNTSTDNDIHLLRFSIPFREYQEILQPKSISSIPSSSHQSIHSSDVIERPSPPLIMPFSPTQSRPHRDRNLRPQSTGSISPQSYYNTVTSNVTTTVNGVATDLSTMSPLPTATTRYSRRYAYVSSPTNTSPDAVLEMISIDAPIHTRIPSALDPSGHAINPNVEDLNCSCKCCSIRSKSRLSLSKLNVSLFNKHENMRSTSNFCPTTRKISPTINELASSFEQRGETSDSENLGGMETGRSETNQSSVKNNNRNESTDRPRRSSLFAGRGTYIDIDRSVMQFPIRAFQPLIRRSGWNLFMFHPSLRRIFSIIFTCFALVGLVMTIYTDSMSISFMICKTIVFFILSLLIISMLVHWLDTSIVLDLLCRWETVLCIVYNLIAIISAIWRSGYEPTASHTLRISNSTVANISVSFGYLFLLFSDACPPSILPRWMRMCATFLVAIGELFIWISYGVIPSDDLKSIPNICMFGCVSLTKLHSLAAANLSFFAFKFFFSLLVWPKSCVILRARISIE